MKTPQIKPLPGMTPLGIKPRTKPMTRRFQLTFDCDNAAFDEDLHGAIADALVQAAKRVRVEGDLHGLVRDTNGNRIGAYDLVGER